MAKKRVITPVVGSRWFRENGGMAPFSLIPVSRALFVILLSEKRSRFSTPATVGCVRSLAGWVGPPSTISRELRRNAATS